MLETTCATCKRLVTKRCNTCSSILVSTRENADNLICLRDADHSTKESHAPRCLCVGKKEATP